MTATRAVTDTIVGDGPKDLADVEVGGLGGGRVTATGGHPFWVDDQGRWVDAGDLEPGDDLRTPTGELVEVTDVRGYRAVRKVHNLTVEGIHTYYVMAGDITALVHNCDTGSAEKLRNALNAAGDLEPARRTPRTILLPAIHQRPLPQGRSSTDSALG